MFPSPPFFPIDQRRQIVMSFVSRDVADYVCKLWHYLGGCPDGDILLGFWDVVTRKHHGIVAFRSNNQLPSVRKGWESKFGSESIELSRVALCAQDGRNYQTSFYVGMALSFVKGLRKFAVCYSYCDRSRHEGVLYRACNFTYLYETKPVMIYVSDEGDEVHSRDSKNKRKKERYITNLGYKVGQSHPKDAYCLPLTKTARKRLMSWQRTNDVNSAKR